MLQAKFQYPILVKKIFKGFYHIWAWPVIRNSEIFRFRTVLEIVRPFYFAKNVKKSVRKLPFFGKVPELKYSRSLKMVIKYSRSLKMVTKLHNRSKQSHFPA